MGKLNAKAVDAAKAVDKDVFLSDGGGLYLRVRPSGLKIWLYRYKVGTKTRWMELGCYPKIFLTEARADAARIAAKRRDGIDPVEERAQEAAREAADAKAVAEALAARAARLTVRGLFERWERLELSGRKDGGAEARRAFEKDVFPKLGGMAAADVTRAMVAESLDRVVERDARIVARNLLGDLRQMFGFAIKRGYVENDPTSHLKRDDFGRKVERDRVLSDAEVKKLVELLPTAGMGAAAVAAVWVMLSTCCRVGELAQARVADVDLDAGEWRIPPDNSKNGKAHTVFLSEFATGHMRALLARASQFESPWVLPARYASGHVDIKSLTKQIGDRQRGAEGKPMKNRSPKVEALVLPGGKWTPHDLRRTGATMMGRLGVRPDVIEKCLNHVEQNRLVRIYQRQELREEQREAWRLLGERLELLTRTDADNVVTLARVAA